MTELEGGVADRRPRPFDLRCQNPQCGREFHSSRRDARTCGPRCRQALARHERAQDTTQTPD
jgi:hypothetical protein